MKKSNKSNPLKAFNDNHAARVKKVTEGSKKLVKAQTGGSSLTKAELDALAHQKRGMGMMNPGETFVKRRSGVMNELGNLKADQIKQLQKYMDKSSTLEKIYQALPNVGVLFGNSAADVPKNSQLQNQKKGGQTKLKKK